MKTESIAIIGYLIIVLILSVPLTIVIFRSITLKPLAYQTLVDLLYRDCIVYNYFCNFCFSLGIIFCLGSSTETLDFGFALILTLFWYFVINLISLSLSLAGILRMTSLWNNSVDQGIQIFGPDKFAIRVVRFASILIGIVFISIVSLLMQIFPGTYYIFYNENSISPSDIMSSNPFTPIYMFPPGIATAINILCKSYDIYLSAKLKDGNSSTKFDLSLGGSIVISIKVFAIVLSTFFSRFEQLWILFPCMITAHAVCLPLYIILSNERMKRLLKEYMSNCLCDVKVCWQFLFSLSVPSNKVLGVPSNKE